ncbi:MAG: SLBB domain-containing protein [Ktedonobacterales bacterium]
MRSIVARSLAARWYVPTLVLLALMLVAGSSAALLAKAGNFPPRLLQPQTHITITGPGVASTTQLQATVLGAIRTPGVYTLTQGARVHDLIELAGGVLSDADLTHVSLAAVLTDGLSVYVPHVGEIVPPERGGKLDINAATATQFHNALGLTLSTAKRIVAYRAARGAFTAVSQLLLVPLSRTIYDRIKNLVTV